MHGWIKRLSVAFVLLFLSCTGQTFADTVRLDFQDFAGSGTDSVTIGWSGNPGGSGNHSWTTTAGRFHFKVASTTSPYSNKLGNVGNNVYTFCLNPRYQMIDPGDYTLTNKLENLPSPNGNQGPLQIAGATKLRILINEVFGNGSLSAYSGSSYWDSVQLAIWKIIGVETGIPNFTISGVADTTSFNAIYNGVQSIYSNASVAGNYSNYLTYRGTGGFMYAYGLDSTSSGGGQDQLYWSTTPGFVIDVPVPAGVVLAGMGIFCVGGINFLRCRKALI